MHNKEIARMHFKSSDKSHESGYLTLHEDGFVHMEPDPPFMDKLLEDERAAVRSARRWTGSLSFFFLIFAIAAALTGWIIGRLEGATRIALKEPRSMDEVGLKIDSDGGFHASIPGNHPKIFKFSWRPGEIDPSEASHFVRICDRFRDAKERRNS